MTMSFRPQFALGGSSIALDARIHAVRGDLADLALAGQIFVPHYARAMPRRCMVPSLRVQDAGSPDSNQVSELLFGEDFMVVDHSGGFAWGYCRHDHYVGYVALDALGDANDDAQSVVTVREATVKKTASPSSATVATLPMGARITGSLAGDYVQTSLGFVRAAALDGSYADAASVAEALLDVPYVWGGRSASGIDCSGLIQMALALSGGAAAPRDSDQQQAALGQSLSNNEALTRNDLIFFPGHVGIMADGGLLIHATTHHGKVVCEPLADVVARIAAKHETPIVARKRLG